MSSVGASSVATPRPSPPLLPLAQTHTHPQPPSRASDDELSLTSASSYTIMVGGGVMLPPSRPSCRPCNCLCRQACCCCWYGIPSLRPLYVSYEFVPWPRKLWWAWLCATQLFALYFRSMLLGCLIPVVFGALVVLSLAWAIRSRGLHRGLSLFQLALWIPLAIYIGFRLAGVEAEDRDDSAINADKELYAYAIVEVITLGISCIWSFLDMLRWLAGGSQARVWGSHSDRGGTRSVSREHSIGSSYSGAASPRIYASPTPHMIGMPIPGSSLLAPPSMALGRSYLEQQVLLDGTPRTRSEALLSRAEENIRRANAQQAQAQAMQGGVSAGTTPNTWMQSDALQRLQQQSENQRRLHQQQQSIQP